MWLWIVIGLLLIAALYQLYCEVRWIRRERRNLRRLREAAGAFYAEFGEWPTTWELWQFMNGEW